MQSMCNQMVSVIDKWREEGTPSPLDGSIPFSANQNQEETVGSFTEIDLNTVFERITFSVENSRNIHAVSTYGGLPSEIKESTSNRGHNENDIP